MIYVEYSKKLFNSVYYPLVRAYARLFLKDKPADPLLRGMVGLAFLVVYRYWPDFVRPRRFGEKLWSRMLMSRHPLLTTISDKRLVRGYVAEKVGTDNLIPLLWSGETPEAIPYDRLPDRFVIKTNHGCRYNVLVTDKARADRAAIAAQLKKWLSENYAEDTYLGIAWGYKNIKPMILIEEFIDDHGQPPVDYKFYCFSGRTELITVHLDRHKNPRSVSVDRDFVRLRFRPGFKQHNIDPPKPRNLAAMLSLAESLAVGFNFIRVDLYSLQDRIYFGELTPYPVGVELFRSFDIFSLDETLGEKWGLEPGMGLTMAARRFKERLGELLVRGMLRVSPLLLTQYRYHRATGKWLDIKDPRSFDEKLLWLNLYWRHPLKVRCADKYAVRSYLEENGLGRLLKELYGVYAHVDEIDFGRLPDQFVLKATHGCGFNIFCKDKARLDIEATKDKLRAWMRTDISQIVGELHYASIVPRIICEAYLQEPSGKPVNDYKVYCFDGRAHCTMACTDRNEKRANYDFYDLGWANKLAYSKTSLLANRDIPKPDAYDEIIAAAEALSKPFPFVRMDFFSVGGRAYFGEMTFSPNGGIDTYLTDLAQATMGDLLRLPAKLL